MVLLLMLLFIIGCLVDLICAVISTDVKTVGTLCVDSSDEDDGPYMFLKLSKDISTVATKKYVILKVDFTNHPSRK